MRPRFALLGLLLSTACATPSAPPASAADPAADGAAVTALLKGQSKDWNAGDLEGFCAVYAEDARFLSPSGVKQGRAQILARYRAKYDTPQKRGRLTLDVLETRAVGDVASVALRWHIARDGAEPASGLSLVVLHRTPEGWRIVQDASM